MPKKKKNVWGLLVFFFFLSFCFVVLGIEPDLMAFDEGGHKLENAGGL
jgi:hypothetical protein